MITLILHLANSEPIKVEVEQMPSPTDQILVGHNPRERNDRELGWVDHGVTQVIFPWWRINYIQVLPDPTAESDFPELFR